jgi:hypothetical protein
MPVTIHLEGGPADGKSYVMPNYPHEFYVATPLPAVDLFAPNRDPLEPVDRKWVYQRVGRSSTYVCSSFEPVEEAINAVRDLGLKMDEYQEREFRDWWRER